MPKRAPILNTWRFSKTPPPQPPPPQNSHRAPLAKSTCHVNDVNYNPRPPCFRFRRLLITMVALAVCMGVYNQSSDAMLELYTLHAMMTTSSSSSSSRLISIVASSTAAANSEIRNIEILEMDPVNRTYLTTVKNSPKTASSKQIGEPNTSPESNIYNNTNNNENVSYVHYVGCCGIGHRLARMSNAYHAAQRLNYALKGSWPSCQKTNVFEYLFEQEQEEAPLWFFGVNNYSRTGQRIKFNNEVPGYTTVRRDRHQVNTQGKATSAPRIEDRLLETRQLSGSSKSSTSTATTATCDTCHWHKIESDYQFYSQLLQKFRHRHAVKAFQEKHAFHNHTVIGMHVRAGNGEGGDFSNKKRGIDNTTAFVQIVSQHVQTLVVQQQQNSQAKQAPPLLFLATDTPFMIDMFRQQLKNVLPVIELPQIRPLEGEGILFGERKRKRDYVRYANNIGNSNNNMGDFVDDNETDNENADMTSSLDAAMDDDDDGNDEATINRQTCLLGWDQAFMDMMLLASSDVVLATRRSSFVQTIPMSMVLGKQPMTERKVRAPYCEISEDETLKMTCHETYMDWCCCISCIQQDQNDGDSDSANDASSGTRHRNNEYVKQLRPELWETPVGELYNNQNKHKTKNKKKKMNNRHRKRQRPFASK